MCCAQAQASSRASALLLLHLIAVIMVDAKTLGVITSLAVGGTVLAVCVVLFECLRRFLPDMYYHRNKSAVYATYADENGRPLGTAPLPSSFWPSTVIPYSHEALRRTHGLDTSLFLRYLIRQSATFACVSLLTAATLFPLYATASNKNLPSTSSERTVGIELLSLANVASQDSARLWFLLVVDIIIIAFLCFRQRADIVHYATVRRAYRSEVRAANYAVIVQDLPKHLAGDEDAVFRLFDREYPEQISAVHLVRNARKCAALSNKYQAAYRKREAALLSAPALDGEPPKLVKGDSGNLIPVEEHLATREEAAFSAAQAARENIDENAPLTSAAIVCFRTRHAALVAGNTPLAFNGMKINRAPEPSAVFWNRFHVTRKTATIRKYITLAAVAALIIFWFIPVAGIQSLSNFQELAKQDGLEFLADLQKSAPEFVKFLEGFLPPVLLLVLNLLAPIFIRLILVHSRFVSLAHLDAAVMRYLYIFFLVTSFLGNVIAGSILGAIDTIRNDPSVSTVVSMLSNTIPSQSSFFLGYIALQLLVGSGIGLLCIGRLLLRPFFLGPAKTERQKLKGNAALAAYPMFKIYSTTGLHILIATVYSTVAPLASIFVCIGLAANYVTLKHVMMYSEIQMYYSAGVLFKTSWSHSFFSILLHQVILVGLFSLKRAPAQAALMAISIVPTYMAFRHWKEKYFKFAKEGTLCDLHDHDEASSDVTSAYAECFVHPGLREVGYVDSMEHIDPQIAYPKTA